MKPGVLVLLATSVLLLCGCASAFAPDPTPTAVSASTNSGTDVACTTENSTISAGDPSVGDSYISVSADIAEFDAAGNNDQQQAISIDASGVVGLAPSTAFDSLEGTPDEWKTAVMDAIHSLGTLPRNLGIESGAILADYGSQFAVPSTRNAVWIRGFVARAETVPFQINCPRGLTVRATVMTFDPAHGKQFTFRCDKRKHPGDSEARGALRAACIASGLP